MMMRLIVVLAASCMLSACATTVTAVLSHDAPSGLSGGDRRPLLVVGPFDDERAGKPCGEQSGNFGSGPAILCDRDPAPFLATALAEELKKVGFDVQQTNRPTEPVDVPVVRGTLLRLYAQPTGGFSHFVMEADVHVRLEVRAPNGFVAQRSFFVKGNRGVGGTVDGAVQESISDATNRVVTNMVAALLSLENEYPELAPSGGEKRP